MDSQQAPLAVGPHICFDIDGTLVEVGADLDHNDPLSYERHTRPIHRAIGRLNAFLDAGGRVSFVTGRADNVSRVTHRQLVRFLGDRVAKGVDIMHRPDGEYDVMACLLYKLDALRFLAPDLYVGDLPMDQTAAVAAGVPFMPAEWWAKGHDLGLVLHPDFRPAKVAKALLPTEVRIEDFDAPGGKYDCLTCGNRALVAPGRLPAVCDSCEKPGPWARAPNALPIEAATVLGAR